MMSTITCDDRKFVKYISETEIDAAIEKVAAAVNAEYKNDIPTLLFVLNGSVIFGADLMKRLDIQCKMSCVRVSSYVGTQSTEVVRNVVGLSGDLEGQRVLVIEDIIDTGNTYAYINQILKEAKVKDVKIATLTYKPDSYRHSLPIDFVGLEIPDKFILGRGMDYNGLGRNLRDIYQVVDE
ncbi:MAG: hypoxanthine phosphoribosyltransferase [Bacteroidales bacterium]|jgi:hypoxanthine phosphoribosyltransferase|nr:hypoxanthine phosphoribosyltransferase [Bacteroidales bacterium]